MSNPNEWHSVRPLYAASLSLMVTGPPWSRSSPKSEYLLKQLTQGQEDFIFESVKPKYVDGVIF